MMNKVETMRRHTKTALPADTGQQGINMGKVANFPDELEHLETIKVKLCDALKDFNEAVERYDKEYMDSKRYLANYRHEIDPREIFQNELAMKQIERAGFLRYKCETRLQNWRIHPILRESTSGWIVTKNHLLIILADLPLPRMQRILFLIGVRPYLACFMIVNWEKPLMKRRLAE